MKSSKEIHFAAIEGFLSCKLFVVSNRCTSKFFFGNLNTLKFFFLLVNFDRARATKLEAVYTENLAAKMVFLTVYSFVYLSVIE